MDDIVLLDYDGMPVSIEDGEILWWYPNDGEFFNPVTRQFEPIDDVDDDFDDNDFDDNDFDDDDFDDDDFDDDDFDDDDFDDDDF